MASHVDHMSQPVTARATPPGNPTHPSRWWYRLRTCAGGNREVQAKGRGGLADRVPRILGHRDPLLQATSVAHRLWLAGDQHVSVPHGGRDGFDLLEYSGSVALDVCAWSEDRAVDGQE